MKVLSSNYEKLTVEDRTTGEVLAAVTDDAITLASDRLVVKLTPSRISVPDRPADKGHCHSCPCCGCGHQAAGQ